MITRPTTRAAAAAVLVLSALALVLVALSWITTDDAEPRADLVDVEAAVPTTGAASAGDAGGSLPEIPVVPLPGPVSTGSTSPADGAGPTAPVGGAAPVRLAIASIGVEAPVVPVGLEPDGSMQVPQATQVGWYEPTGVRPGDPGGSAVLAAHVDFQGRRGAFFDLRGVAEGAEITVTGADGVDRRFVVTERLQVDKDDLPVEELFRTTGGPTLTLITCGGAFDRSARHYRDNIVVRATPA